MMGAFLACVAGYVAVSVCVGLWLSYYQARTGIYGTDEDRNFQVFGWPLIVAGVILVGPFMLAEDLGNRARIKRRDAENAPSGGSEP
jgi:hypothetical protein